MNLDNITPVNDVVFKMIFADPEHKRLLVHLLNSAIVFRKRMTDLVITNAEIIKSHVLDRGCRLDIEAETNTGELINIEMQVGTDSDMIARSLFNWTQVFSKQIVVGEQYSKLRRTIALNFINFNLFEDDRFWHELHITDDESHEVITDKFEMLFVELKKMKERENHSLLSFWVEFIRNPYSERCEELYKEVPELKEAKKIFDAAKVDPKKRALIEIRAESILNLSSMLASARARGRAEAERELAEERAKAEKELAEERAKAEKELAEERAKAERELAKKRAKAEGELAKKRAKADKAEREFAEECAKAEDDKKTKKRESAKKLLQIGLSVAQVAQGLGLSIEEVEEIKKKEQ